MSENYFPLDGFDKPIDLSWFDKIQKEFELISQVKNLTKAIKFVTDPSFREGDNIYYKQALSMVPEDTLPDNIKIYLFHLLDSWLYITLSTLIGYPPDSFINCVPPQFKNSLLKKED